MSSILVCSVSVRSLTIPSANAFARSAASSGEAALAIIVTRLLDATGSTVTSESKDRAVRIGVELARRLLGDIDAGSERCHGLDVTGGIRRLDRQSQHGRDRVITLERVDEEISAGLVDLGRRQQIYDSREQGDDDNRCHEPDSLAQDLDVEAEAHLGMRRLQPLGLGACFGLA